jgi:DNA-binding PadR family transcriptional regulator
MPKDRILPHIILGIVATCNRRVTGKEITDFVQRDLGEFWQVAHSQVYPELKRMTQDGWITCHAVPGNEKEKQYELTAKGREILEQWLAIPNESTPHQKDIFSLKMYFIEDRSDPRVSELLTYQIQVIKSICVILKNVKRNFFRKLMVNMFLMGNI